MRITQAGIALIKEFEGCELNAYPDPATGGDPITIGIGHTGPEVHLGMTITEEEAEDLLRADLWTTEACVEKAVGAYVNESEFSACVCLAFNIGCEAFKNSTLVKMIRAGNMRGAADQFLRWNKANGAVMNGLTRRRRAERELFLT